MATIDAYEWFRISALLILIVHFVGLVPIWPRYVGNGFDSDSLLRRRLPAFVALLLALVGLLVSLFTQIALALIPALTLAWYVHINRRYVSLARGAGAVGYVPYFTLAYLFTVGLVREYVPDSVQAFRLVTAGYTITWAAILVNSGIVKAQEGYLMGRGIRSFLTNPHWSRGWTWFQEHAMPAKLVAFLGISGVGAEVLGGSILFIPQFAWVGAILMGIMFLIIGIFLKLYTLPWLSLASAAFLAAYSLALPHNEDLLRGDWAFVRILPVTLVIIAFYLFFPVAQILGLIIFTTPIRHSLVDANLLTRALRALCAFRWRVFTQEVINTYVGLSLISRSGRDGDFANMKVSYQLSCETIATFRLATESVTITSVFNTLKSETYFAKFFDRLDRYNRCHPLDKHHEWVVWTCAESKDKSQWLPVLRVSCTSDAIPEVVERRLRSAVLSDSAISHLERLEDRS